MVISAIIGDGLTICATGFLLLCSSHDLLGEESFQEKWKDQKYMTHIHSPLCKILVRNQLCTSYVGYRYEINSFGISQIGLCCRGAPSLREKCPITAQDMKDMYNCLVKYRGGASLGKADF